MLGYVIPEPFILIGFHARFAQKMDADAFPGYSFEPYHTGYDRSCLPGDPIYANASGQVTIASVGKVLSRDGYMPGYIEIHNGTDPSTGSPIYTGYGHPAQVVIQVGDLVQKGQVIGYCGATQAPDPLYSANYHTHFTWTDRMFAETYVLGFDGKNSQYAGFYNVEQTPTYVIPLPGLEPEFYLDINEEDKPAPIVAPSTIYVKPTEMLPSPTIASSSPANLNSIAKATGPCGNLIFPFLFLIWAFWPQIKIIFKNMFALLG